MNCKLRGSAELKLFYILGDRHQFKFYRCPRCRLVVYDTRTGVNQEKYILTRVDPQAATRQNRGNRQTYAVNPLQYALFRNEPIGNKARVLLRRSA